MMIKNLTLAAFLRTISLVLIVSLLVACKGSIDYQSDSENDNSDNSITIIEPNEDDYNDGGDFGDFDPLTGFNPSCSEQTNLVDGAGGFLWKPESESDGNLVILFPSKFVEAFNAVCVGYMNGIECGEFAEFGNGNRQHWRFPRPGSEYSGQVFVENHEEACDWFVSDPSVRQD